MTTYSKETALYDTGAIASDISTAGETASKYITYVDANTGIRVHNANDTTNYLQLNSSGSELFKNELSVAKFGESVRVGNEQTSSIALDDDSISGNGANGKTFFTFNGTGTQQNVNHSRNIYTGTQTDLITKTIQISTEVLNEMPSAFYVALRISSIGVSLDFTKGTSSSHQNIPISGVTYSVTYTVNSNTDQTIQVRSNQGVANTDAYVNIRYVTQETSPIYILGGGEASGAYAIAEGDATVASGDYSHAEGFNTTTSFHYCHAEGRKTTASGNSAHAEGYNAKATGDYSHAEGNNTKASGSCSHAEGDGTTASGHYSHAEGSYTTAKGRCQSVIGKYNVVDNNDEYSFIIGNGTGNGSSSTSPSNAFTVDWSGNVKASGDIYPQNTKMTDFVVGDGTSGNWKYRKWKSGKFEAWHSGSVALTSDGQLSSYNPTWYRSHYAVTVPSAIGTITIETAICSNTSPTSFHMQGNTVVSGSTITQYCVRGGGTLTGNVTAYVYVTGTYS